MKHKAFLVLIVLGFTFGTMALANYVEPQSLTNPSCTYSQAPDCNVPEVVKTGPGANVSGTRSVAVIKSKIGIGDGINSTNTSFVAGTGSNTSSYIGTGTGTKGGFMEKLVVFGATGVVGGSNPKNILVQINNRNNSTSGAFDQYARGTQYEYPIGASLRMTRALEAIVAGRYISRIMITSSADTANNDATEPLSLKLQATSGSNPFLPTTNIGLGNTCNLHPYDLGVAPGDGGGCPEGSYMIWYGQPTFSGTLSSTNNTNGVTVATCREFNPASSPTNTGHCNTGRSFTNIVEIDHEPYSGSTCQISLDDATTFNNLFITGKNVKIRWWMLGGNPARSSYSAANDQMSFFYNCSQTSWEVQIYDDYGQFFMDTI